jgi:uncharacterized protein with ATP-grasp and redox domains
MVSRLADEVRNAKEHLPVLYHQLTKELFEYSKDRKNLSALHKIIFNGEAAICRATLCDALLKSLHERAISSFHNKTSEQMVNTGSQMVGFVYERISELLRNTIQENSAITTKFDVGTGEFHNILAKFLSMSNRHAFILLKYVESKNESATIRGYIQATIDTVKIFT